MFARQSSDVTRVSRTDRVLRKKKHLLWSPGNESDKIF